MKTIVFPIIYIVATLVLSWAYTGFLFSRPERSRYYPYIMFIPAGVAIPVSLLQYQSLAHLLSPIMARPSIIMVSFAFVFPIIIIATCAMLGKIIGIASFKPENLKNLLAIKGYSLSIIFMGILAMFGEEYGWRGYLLPELSKAWGPVAAATAVGIVWALWHGPLLFGLAKVMGTGNPLVVAAIQMGAVVVFSFPFAYAYLQSGNIILPIIFHYVWNYFNPIVLGNMYRNRGGIMDGNIVLINGEGVFGILIGSLFVVWFILQYSH